MQEVRALSTPFFKVFLEGVLVMILQDPFGHTAAKAPQFYDLLPFVLYCHLLLLLLLQVLIWLTASGGDCWSLPGIWIFGRKVQYLSRAVFCFASRIVKTEE